MKRLFLKFRLWLARVFARLRIAKGINYINGADTLPPPLSAEEEDDILSQINDRPVLRRTLVERNLRLVVYIARKFENTGVGIEDLISIGTIGLIKAANTFCPDKKIKLATYASRCIENEILMYIRKNQCMRYETSLDEPLSADGDGNELLLSDVISGEDSVGKRIEDDEEKKVIARAIESLSPREREIIEMRFGLGGRKELTQKEVADRLGISQSYISRLEKKTIERLKEEIVDKI